MTRHQLVWSLTRQTFCRALQARYRFALAPGSDPEPEPPFIAVSNHGNFFDPWILGRFQRSALHIMMNDDGFRAGPLSRWYLSAIGAFPKKKGAQDIRAMKSTLSFLKAGEPVLIFPEGQATWDGETQPIYGGIERMVKRAGCPLVIFRLRGNFLTRPWWAPGPRRGRIELSRRVLTREDLARMSNEEVLGAIRDGIRASDVTDPANLSIPFAGRRLAEGVERLVWTCAACGRTGTLRTAGDRVTCSSCDASWLVDAHCRLHGHDGTTAPFPDLHAWLARERLQARAAVAEASDGTILCIDSSVTMLVEDGHGAFVSDRTGTLSLTRSELLFEPGGEPEACVRLPVAALDSYVIQKKDLFEATFEGRSYRFDLTGRSPMKWLVHVRYLRGWEEIEKTGVI